MRTGKETTIILLDRGTEDKALWEDINSVFIELYRLYSPPVVIKKYRILYDFHQKLLKGSEEK